MARFLDARIRLVFGVAEMAGPDDAVLREGEGEDAPLLGWFTPASEGHAAGCACCAPRNNAARALSLLFLARVRGDAGFYKRLVAIPCTAAGRAEIEAALAHDPVTSSRFRLEDHSKAEG